MQDGGNASKGCARVLAEQIGDALLQRLQRLCHTAVLEQSQQRVLEYRKLFQSRVAEHPLYDFVQPAELVRQDAHHGDDAGDHTHNRQRPGQQTTEAASNRAVDTPQQTGPAAEYAPDSFPGTGVCDTAYYASRFPQQTGKTLLEDAALNGSRRSNARDALS